jgi:hypothetical protein
MSQLVSDWSSENWKAVDRVLTDAPKGSGYIEVWGVRHYMKQARYDMALKFLDSISGRRDVGEFSLTQRTKALFNSFHEKEALAAAQQAVISLPEERGHELQAWMCAQRLQNGCEAISESTCSEVAKQTNGKDFSVDYREPYGAMAQILAYECKDKENGDYAELASTAADEDWQKFLRGVLKQKKSDKEAAYALFSEILQDSDVSEVLQIEAMRRITQVANSTQVAQVIKTWKEFDSKEVWIKTGNFLARRLAEEAQGELALEVASRLEQAKALSPEVTLELARLEPKAKASRLPASDNFKRGKK